MNASRTLYRKYTVLIGGFVVGALFLAGIVQAYFSYQDNRAAVSELTQEKSLVAALRIDDYIKSIVEQIAWVTLPTRELATIAESGYPGFEVTGWIGLFSPAGPPAIIVRKLHLETVKGLALPDLRAKFADLGLEIIGNSPDAFAAIIKSEIPKWAKVIKESSIKPD